MVQVLFSYLIFQGLSFLHLEINLLFAKFICKLIYSLPP